MFNHFLHHMWSTYIWAFVHVPSLMHVYVCVLHIPSTFTPFKHSCQDRTTHGEELLTPWSHLQVMAANMLWVIRYVFQPLWPLRLFPLSELCYWFKSSDPEQGPRWSWCGLERREKKTHGKVWIFWRVSNMNKPRTLSKKNFSEYLIQHFLWYGWMKPQTSVGFLAFSSCLLVHVYLVYS